MLNDSDNIIEKCTANVYLIANGEKKHIASVSTPKTDRRSNTKGSEFKFEIKDSLPERFSISIETENDSLNSIYNFVHNKIVSAGKEIKAVLNSDFSDFLK